MFSDFDDDAFAGYGGFELHDHHQEEDGNDADYFEERQLAMDDEAATNDPEPGEDENEIESETSEYEIETGHFDNIPYPY